MNILKNNKAFARLLILTIVVLISLSLYPIFLFEHRIKGVFFDDYCDNVYLFSYVSNYFKFHKIIPVLLNADTLGSNMYLMYGYLFYPFMAFFSYFFGGLAAVKIVVVLLCTVRILFVYRLLLNVNINYANKIIIAIIVSWSVYDNSVLFSAGSLPSVIGAQIIGIGLIMMIIGRIEGDGRILFVSMLMIAMGALFWPGHMIHTTIITMPLLIRNINKKEFLVAVLFIGVVSFPYFIELYSFALKTPNYNLGLGYFDFLDTLRNRLLFYPYNSLNNSKGIIPFDTPYIDTQINVYVPILIIIIYIAERRLDKMSVIYFVIGIFYLVLSVSQDFARYVPGFLKILHFHFRYIHYIEMAFMISLIMQLAGVKKEKKYYVNVLSFVLGAVAVCVLIRTDHNVLAKGVPPFDNWGPVNIYPNMSSQQKIDIMFKRDVFNNDDRKQVLLSEIPRSAAQAWSYTDIGNVIEKEKYKILRLSLSDIKIGRYYDEDYYVQIPIFPFSGNNIYVDKKPVITESVYLSEDPLFTTIFIKKGFHHIDYKLYHSKVSANVRTVFVLIYIVVTLSLLLYCVAVFLDDIVDAHNELKVQNI